LSPETGIIDSHSYMRALRGDLEDLGGMVAFNTPIERLKLTGESWAVHFGGADPQTITVDAVVNSAGLGAQKLARATEGYPQERVPPLYLAKGNYFSYGGRPVFSRLIDAPEHHGAPGLVQLFGIESPGLTSSLSLGEEVAGYLSS